MKSFWKAFVLILTLNCEQSARLVSESFDRRLGWAERMAVFCHHRICRSSRELAKQLKIIQESFQKTDTINDPAIESGLQPAARSRILEAIRKHQLSDS